jgi:glyoxylase-like metal-dependent hydrolase (beta-lactamase superfamily II)
MSSPDAASVWTGGVIASDVNCVLAPNPSPWTLEGTNTYLIGEAGGKHVVVDPGPADREHLQRVSQLAQGPIAAIVLTHAHIDHSEGAPDLSALVGAPVISSREIAGLDLGSVELLMHRTPGHSSDSVCITVSSPTGKYLLSGDTILGRGTTLVAHPDGVLSEYFDSLRLLRDHCDEQGITKLLPGHGPTAESPVTLIDFYEKHRLQRLEQIRSAIQNGSTTVESITDLVYADVDPKVRIAAELTVAAQLHYLETFPPR